MADISQRLYPLLEYLSMVAYLDSALDSASLTTILNGCRSLAGSVLGDRSAHYTIHEVGPRDEMRSGLPSASLQGRTRLLDYSTTIPTEMVELPHLTMWCSPRNAGRYAAYTLVEDLCSIVYHPRPVESGESLNPLFVLGFNLDRLVDEQREKLTAVAGQFFLALAMTGKLLSGLCDVADVRETVLGREYVNRQSGWTLFTRQLSRRLWVRTGAHRAHCARGLFWGNLLNASMLEALGGDPFLHQYIATECGPDVNLVSRFDDGSALLLLSASVSDFMFPLRSLMPTTIDRAAWLYERLSHAGLLCGTDPKPFKCS